MKAKPIAARAANARVEGSGTAAALPAKLGVAENAPEAAAPDEPETKVPLSTAKGPEPPSIVGEMPVENEESAGSTANTRLSNRLTSNSRSVAARRSMAAMRFSSTSPVVLLIAPLAIAC